MTRLAPEFADFDTVPAAASRPNWSPEAVRSELKRLWNFDDFRDGQAEIVQSAVEGRDTLAVLPTGGGKSLTYQLPAMLADGATLVLSPLIALMKDQAENLPPAVAAQTTIINSSLEMGEAARRLAALKSGKIKMVYAAPERLRQPPFLHALRRANVSLVVVDEAHCISQWGHDFRPDYRAVGQAVSALNPRSVLAVTATATPDVQDDIERQLGREMRRIVRPTWRDNLFLSCRKVQNEDEKLWATLDICKNTPGAGLVYAGSREKCEQLAKMLKRQGIAAGFYHAGLPQGERAQAQDDFMAGRVRVMAATVAFGMGVDKSDIRFLVHYNPSRSLENYYQEAGRAGRDGAPSFCTLLVSSSDAASVTRHLREDILTLDHMKAVHAALRATIGKKRVGPVNFDALVQECGGDEGLVRASLPILEEANLVSRSVDVPLRFGLYPDFSFEGEPSAGWDEFSRVIQNGGDWDSGALSDATGIALPELEETLLRFQEAGHMTFRAFAREFLIELLPPPADARLRMQETLAHRARSAQSRADAMLAYARDRKCRHGMIARYFGDRWPNVKCGACDVCSGSRVSLTGDGSSAARVGGSGGTDAEPVSSGQAALAALQIVWDLAQGYRPFALGKTGLLRSLRGTPDAPVTQGRTQAFGTLARLKKSEVERLIEALIEQNYLRRDDDDDYRRLYLTVEGQNAVSSGIADVEWRMTSAAIPAPKTMRTSGGAGKAADPLPDDVNEELLAALKAWRRELSQAENVPTYVVFADKVLLALAARQPTNEFDLLEIPGIGPAKAAKFGEAVLDMVRKHNGKD